MTPDDATGATPRQNWALLIEYDGAGFVGWQRQRGGLSIQEMVERAASRLADGAPVASIVAGRTDAGVHAAGQVAQILLPVRAAPLPAERLRAALNHHLRPHRIAILAAAPVPPGWNARFSAIGREYRYVILDRPARPALEEGQVWHVARRLDAASMAEAARSLLGRHDFSSFRASACQAKSPLRTLDRLDVCRVGEGIEITAAARSFLHHQVRNMVGTLALVGAGKWRPADVGAALAARDRRAAGPTAPPQGLFLTRVRYPEDPFAAGAGAPPPA